MKTGTARGWSRYRTALSRSAAPLCLFAVFVALWWLRVTWMSGNRLTLLNVDALDYWIPLVREAARQWRSGSVPLWNPYQALGTPLFATLQVGAAYPLNALYLFLDVRWAWLLTASCTS